ncbi:hypothetical protein ABIC02_007568 [Bradyrhizobium sp. RT5a]
MKFAFNAKHRTIWPVAGLCDALGVSRSGFNAWLTRSPSVRSRSDEELSGKVKASFTSKITAELEAGRVPWVQPWARRRRRRLWPCRRAQRPAVNLAILWRAATEHSPVRVGLHSAKRCRSVVTSARASAARLSSMPTASYRSTKSASRARTVRKRRPFRSSTASLCKGPTHIHSSWPARTPPCKTSSKRHRTIFR